MNQPNQQLDSAESSPLDPPTFPAGPMEVTGSYNREQYLKYVEKIEAVPVRVRQATEQLDDSQLDTKYRNWTIRQIVHHLADSHINCYVRFKWALTEDEPAIKTYDESRWSELPDAQTAPIESSLTLLSGIHHRWGQLLRHLSEEQLTKGFFHPEMNRIVTLSEAVPSYAWHADHHLAQIQWIRDKHDWPK